MVPIVSPWFFYLMNVVDALKGISIAIFIVSAIGLVALIIARIYNEIESKSYSDNKDYIPIYKHYAKIAFIIAFASALAIILLPWKSTLIEMEVARNVTQTTLNAGIDALKEAVDYIVNAIKSI